MGWCESKVREGGESYGINKKGEEILGGNTNWWP
jgi:hypothetical protein